MLLKFVMNLLRFASRESRTLQGFENQTEFSDPENTKKGSENIVREVPEYVYQGNKHTAAAFKTVFFRPSLRTQARALSLGLRGSVRPALFDLALALALPCVPNTFER